MNPAAAQCNAVQYVICNTHLSYHNHDDVSPPEMIKVQFHLYLRPVWCNARPIKSHLLKKVDFFFYHSLHQRENYLYLWPSLLL